MGKPGKIARLPRETREELNRRLDDGVSGVELVDWLNGRPEVKELLAREFEGREIREQNLSDWKQYGYQNWLVQRNMTEVMASLGELGSTMGGMMSEMGASAGDDLTLALEAWYADILLRKHETSDGFFEHRLGILNKVCDRVIKLRRGDHGRKWLGIAEKKLRAQGAVLADGQDGGKPAGAVVIPRDAEFGDPLSLRNGARGEPSVGVGWNAKAGKEPG